MTEEKINCKIEAGWATIIKNQKADTTRIDTEHFDTLENLTKHEILKKRQILKFDNRQYIIDKITEFERKHKAAKTIIKKIRKQFNYREFAKEYCKNYGIYYDENQIFWLWNQKEYRWIIIDDITLMNAVDEALDFDTLRNQIKQTIIEAFKREGRKNTPKELKPTQIQFKDKIIDITTMEEIPATQQYFAVNPIPHKLGKTGKTPTINKFFKEWVGKENTIWLNEIIAFCMAREYFIHRIFCLTGSGANGKSTFLDLINKFLGSHNVSSTELETLVTSRFETIKLFKKLACQMGETNFTTMSKTSLIKRLSGQDKVSFEIKKGKHFDDVNYAKIIISTNSLPITEDKTKGFYRRWETIDFPNEFEEKKDVLKKIPEEEYENLARKCCFLLRKLMKTSKFSRQGNIQERMDRYEERSNPLTKFIVGNYEKDNNGRVPLYALHDEFIEYLNERGYRKISKPATKKLLVAEGYDVATEAVQRDEGKTHWVFVYGLKKREKPDWDTRNMRNTGFHLDSLYGKVSETSCASCSSCSEGEKTPKKYENQTKIQQIVNKSYDALVKEFDEVHEEMVLSAVMAENPFFSPSDVRATIKILFDAKPKVENF